MVCNLSFCSRRSTVSTSNVETAIQKSRSKEQQHQTSSSRWHHQDWKATSILQSRMTSSWIAAAQDVIDTHLWTFLLHPFQTVYIWILHSVINMLWWFQEIQRYKNLIRNKKIGWYFFSMYFTISLWFPNSTYFPLRR